MLATAQRFASKSTLLRRYRQRIFRDAPDDREPVVLRHRRIYILPTRRGLAFIATLAMMLVTSLNYALSLGFMVTFVLAGLAAASLLHTFRNLAGLELRPLSAGETFAGGALPFALALAGGPAPRYVITLATGKGYAPTFDVPPEAALPVTLEVPTPRRGRVALGRVTVSSDYPLGLWRAWAYVHFPLAGVVFPAPEREPPPLPTRPGGHDVNALGRGEEADLAGLRDYVDGDAPQRVAWKAVARGVGWYTKQFEGSGGGGPADLAWSSMPAALSTEERLSRLTAWVLGAERTARPFALTIPGAALPVGQGRDHRRAALTALALHEAR